MNVFDNLANAANIAPHRDALIFEGKRWTFERLERFTAAASEVLQTRGLNPGDRCALMLGNTPSFPVWYFAALRLGAIVVSISPRLAADEIAFMLNDSGASLLVADEQAAIPELPAHVREVLRVSDWADRCQGQALQPDAARVDAEHWDAHPNDPAVILYTSGTTGFPKGAVLSHANIRTNVHAFNHLCEMRPGDRLLLCVPLFHCFGQNAVLNAGLNVGATIVMQRRFDLPEAIRLIANHSVTKLMTVPATFQWLLEACEPDSLATVNYCFSAAAKLSPELSRNWIEKFGLPIYEGYGLTETSPFASYNHKIAYRPGSIGSPVDGVEMKVVDVETGEKCEPDRPGEIWVRGPNVMLGYWNRPQETAEAIRDGWLRSGDIGRCDAAGYFYLLDRLKDMISVGGLKVFPAEVERVLVEHPDIVEAAVVGADDSVLGEKPVAFVRVADNAGREWEPWTRDILQHCQDRLADYKRPKDLRRIDAIPRNPTGKVLKAELRRLLADQPESAAIASKERLEQNAARPQEELDDGPLVHQLHSVHAIERPRLLTAELQRELESLLNAEPPGPKDRLLESGLDSLSLVELRDRLQQRLGRGWPLPATLVFDHPSIAELTDFLLAEFESRQAPPHETASQMDRRRDAIEEQPIADGDLLHSEIQTLSDDEAMKQLLRELQD